MELNSGIGKESKDIINQSIIYDKFLKMIKHLVQNNFSKYNEIESIILFGSYTTLTFTEESDIDLCILLKKNTKKHYEDLLFDKFLDLGKHLDKSIQCVFIFQEDIKKWDRTFIENILAEGKLIFGSPSYYDLFIKYLKLEPFQLITLNLRELDNSAKMKIKRILYGYKTKKKYSNKIYSYNKKGLVQNLKGIRLGKGSFIIPENQMTSIIEKLSSFDVKVSSYRVWMQKI
ncbi:MAG: nucleotidyltransferase domain-containing protein [Promethearchaeota archaeon]